VRFLTGWRKPEQHEITAETSPVRGRVLEGHNKGDWEITNQGIYVRGGLTGLSYGITYNGQVYLGEIQNANFICTNTVWGNLQDCIHGGEEERWRALQKRSEEYVLSLLLRIKYREKEFMSKANYLGDLRLWRIPRDVYWASVKYHWIGITFFIGGMLTYWDLLTYVRHLLT
jgi:hypothetical protein